MLLKFLDLKALGFFEMKLTKLIMQFNGRQKSSNHLYRKVYDGFGDMVLI
ncbi:hypothetical protein [Pedobacter ureilyticus]|uniref:Uncharacterized protein n=1 Tax=Pedobacter ureilyticus TaxID=1393051 RepID=A0ABW9J9U5_9SPHI|nr:hypothetical protein [Pedobacter helvus]